ncbi:3-ketoacyl-ACP reductase [Streptomyces carminius]|uniref:3-ketoacyl-ACP reductase n=1 Tax=Streptomyces carminius TaxID=2665496 RepID=A0A2M8LSG5_9ACTN|nr:SDR family oxidoreductase [Streptomyces carminius]PJE94912.1 3-ketoacyl-ACP reductase [Streptomyces carminius]
MTTPAPGARPPERRPEREPRRAVVVGGSRGIGAAVALRFAAEGLDTAVAARDPEQLNGLRDHARELGLGLTVHQVDVRSAESVDGLFAALTEGGGVDVCVNAAGRNLSRRLISPPRDGSRTWRTHGEQDWRDVVDLCLTGTFLVGRAAAAAMAAAGRGGVIVPVVSCTWRGSWGQSAYAAAKAGVVSLTRSWALELGEYGIRVVAIAPGVVDGAALREKCAAVPAHAAFMDRLRAQVPLGRFADESEVAETALHAVRNTYLTGTVLDVDGGGFPGRVR